MHELQHRMRALIELISYSRRAPANPLPHILQRAPPAVDVLRPPGRPCRYPGTDGCEDERLAIVDVVKHRNGPTGQVFMNFEDKLTRFQDRQHGVDGLDEPGVNLDEEM